MVSMPSLSPGFVLRLVLREQEGGACASRVNAAGCPPGVVASPFFIRFTQPFRILRCWLVSFIVSTDVHMAQEESTVRS
jgi:hypothetical protein